jgi:hypothetical protein
MDTDDQIGGVRCKFTVTSKSERAAAADLTLRPVTTGDHNLDWTRSTPSGEIKLTITRRDASDFFEVGRDFYVDFSRAD